MDQQGQPNFASFGGQGYVNPGGNVVFSSADVPEQGSKKKFVIIGLIVGAVAIVAVVLMVVLGGGGLFGGSLAGFNELREFIEKGDAETRALFSDEDADDSDSEESAEESSEESDYIMAIQISEQGETEVRKYYAKLAKLEQEFYKKSVDKVDAGLLSEYENALKVLKNAIDYYEAKEGLIAAYENGGESGAETYFEENISCSDGAGDLASVCSLEEKYYTAVLTEHKVYAEAGCYTDSEYDVSCAIDYYGLIQYDSRLTEDGEPLAFSARMRGEEAIKKMNLSLIALNNSMVGDE